MAWKIEITQRLKTNHPSNFSIDRSYVTAIKRSGTNCSITTDFTRAKVYKNKSSFQKLLDFFEQSKISYKLIAVDEE